MTKIMEKVCIVGGILIGAFSGWAAGDKFSKDVNYIWGYKIRPKGKKLSEPVSKE